MNKETIEIRWHGRGGQGAVTASKLLAQAALHEGKYFQGMPDYGAERMGAPVKAFTRVSAVPIQLYCQVTEPDVVAILDPTLLGVVDVTEGLKPDGVLIVNTSEPVEKIRAITGYAGRIATVDATAISLEILGRNLPNTPMLGAVVRESNVVAKDSMLHMMKKVLGATMKEKVVAGNVTALEQAFERVQGSGGQDRG